MAKLVVRQGKNAGFEFMLDPERTDPITLGRRSANQMQVMDEKASRQHASVYCIGGNFFVRDLGSRNGTQLNGEKLEREQPLEVGDVIRIGSTEIEMVEGGADEPITLEIPGYQLLSRIGHGAMGEIYQARQISMDRIVALKVLGERYGDNPEFIDQFVREARAAGRLNHPNIIHVHDVGDSDGRHYFSMEFVDGTSLARIIRSEKTIAVDRVVDMALQVARALEYAHNNGIVHRDVKPHNIMVTRDGVVKLSDLGIAKSFEDTDPGDRESVLGSPHYMAPEQAQRKPIDHRADIYSLGATLYHMLTGVTPFQGDTPAEVIRAHMEQDLTAIQELNPDVPAPLARAIEKMMAKNPDKRYQSMGALIEDLQKVQVDREKAGVTGLDPYESTILPPDPEVIEARRRDRRSAPERDVPQARSRGKDAAAILGVVLGLVALFFLTLVLVQNFVKPRTDETESEPEQVQAQQEGENNIAANGASRRAQLLQRAKDYERDGHLANARLDYETLCNQYPGTDEAMEAQTRLEDIERIEREQREEAARTALLDAQTFAAANPEDLNQQAVQFENVARDHAGTEAAEEALRRAEALQQEIASAAELADRQAWREARAEAEALRYAEPPEYQAAVNRLQAFMANHAGGPHVAEAQQMIGEIRGEVSAELAETRERANEMVARGNYDRAIELVDHFTSTYRLDEFSTQAAALKKEIETKLLEGYMRAAEAANTHADNFRFDRAISEFKRLRDRYRGTSFSEMASARVESLEKLKRLHQLVIDSIEQRGQQAGRVPEALLPEILQQQGIEKVFLAEADEIGMELMYSPNDHPPYVGRHPMPWEKVTAQQYYAVLEHLYPRTPRPDDAVIELIAAFTSAHKLDRESEIWRAMLEQ